MKVVSLLIDRSTLKPLSLFALSVHLIVALVAVCDNLIKLVGAAGKLTVVNEMNADTGPAPQLFSALICVYSFVPNGKPIGR